MRRRRFCAHVWWLFAAACLWPWEVRAQITALDDFLGRSRPAETAADAKPAGAQPTKQAAELQAKRAAIAERLSVALRTLESTDNPAPAEGLSGEVERLKRLGGLYAQQQAAATRGAELEAKKQQAHARLARLREKGIGEPPYSFFLLDELRDELHSLTGRAESATAASGGATDSLRDAKAAVDEAHRKRRQAAESQPASKQPEGHAARPSLKLLEQDAQIANEQFKLRQTELANERLNKLVIELSIALVEEKIERVAPQVTLSAEEQQEKLVELDKEEAEIEDDRMSFGERLAQVWTYVKNVWNYEIILSEGEPVTVSMVIWGIILLVLGLLGSRWLSAALGHRFLPRLGVHESAAAALQSLSFYLLVMLTALLALRWINVPLTLFTFLGGALAIGVGFGSQNLVNNFISGLILLAERPIRVGDVIEIDSLVGSVDAIGARSTRIRTASNYEIIVPNSSFLERNVVNWTLSDKRVRCTISVGLAYGSPTREVARWLKKAALEHGQVLERPEPFVWFVNFGDNALEFELHYWIQIRAMSERRRIESDLRFIIDQYFREAGLVIAFPQRDLHLSNLEPLKVALLPADEARAEQQAFKAA